MSLGLCEFVVVAAAITAILMTGCTQLPIVLSLYAAQTLLIATSTGMIAASHHNVELYGIALIIGVIKGIAIPIFLNRLIHYIKIRNDSSVVLAAPLTMHLSVILLGLSFLFAQNLPLPPDGIQGWTGATSSISLILTGLVIMLTRRLAIVQVIGFLVIENGIYLFALTQTKYMPLIIEMGVLLDVLVGVMIAGLLIFRIQKSFEHIDVTQMAELKD